MFVVKAVATLSIGFAVYTATLGGMYSLAEETKIPKENVTNLAFPVGLFSWAIAFSAVSLSSNSKNDNNKEE